VRLDTKGNPALDPPPDDDPTIAGQIERAMFEARGTSHGAAWDELDRLLRLLLAQGLHINETEFEPKWRGHDQAKPSTNRGMGTNRPRSYLGQYTEDAERWGGAAPNGRQTATAKPQRQRGDGEISRETRQEMTEPVGRERLATASRDTTAADQRRKQRQELGYEERETPEQQAERLLQKMHDDPEWYNALPPVEKLALGHHYRNKLRAEALLGKPTETDTELEAARKEYCEARAARVANTGGEQQ
jgi:hypothetical protein